MKINMHTSHPSAFISSTFLDLAQERNVVAKVLRELNLNINALDTKPASNNSSRHEILSGIKESDIIILIVGERYGSIIPKMTLSKELSITRWEYQTAVKNFGKHALVYFKKVECKDPIYFDDPLSDDFEIKRTYLASFKQHLSNTHNPKYFVTAEELAEEVKKAIISTYRSGVRSLVTENQSLMKKIETLELENQRLKNEALTSINRSPDRVLGSLISPMPKGLLGGINDFQQTNGNNLSGLGLLGSYKT